MTVVILFSFALIHTILLGLFGDTKKVMMKKKVQEQAKFEKLVEDAIQNQKRCPIKHKCKLPRVHAVRVLTRARSNLKIIL